MPLASQGLDEEDSLSTTTSKYKSISDTDPAKSRLATLYVVGWSQLRSSSRIHVIQNKKVIANIEVGKEIKDIRLIDNLIYFLYDNRYNEKIKVIDRTKVISDINGTDENKKKYFPLPFIQVNGIKYEIGDQTHSTNIKNFGINVYKDNQRLKKINKGELPKILGVFNEDVYVTNINSNTVSVLKDGNIIKTLSSEKILYEGLSIPYFMISLKNKMYVNYILTNNIQIKENIEKKSDKKIILDTIVNDISVMGKTIYTTHLNNTVSVIEDDKVVDSIVVEKSWALGNMVAQNPDSFDALSPNYISHYITTLHDNQKNKKFTDTTISFNG